MGDNQQKKSGGRRPSGKQQAEARRAARRAAREAVLGLLFETEYHEEDTPEAVFLRALGARGLSEIPADDAETPAIAPKEEAHIRTTYLCIMENIALIDALIGRHAKGWKTGRLSRVSRAILRLGVYELAFDEKTPAPIAINEAVELTKKFDEPRARAFVNGVLNAVKDELTENGGRLPEGLLAATVRAEDPEGIAEAASVEPTAIDDGDHE